MTERNDSNQQDPQDLSPQAEASLTARLENRAAAAEGRGADAVFAGAQAQLDAEASPETRSETSVTAELEEEGATSVFAGAQAQLDSDDSTTSPNTPATEAEAAPVVELRSPQHTRSGFGPRLAAIAAVLLLIAGGVFLFNRGDTTEQATDGVADPGDSGDNNREADDGEADNSEADDGESEPPEPLAEEFQNPFGECGPALDTGGELVADRALLEELRRHLQSELMEPGGNDIVSMGGPESIWGRISVGLSTRNQATIDRIIAIASEPEFIGPDLEFDGSTVCLELPPEDFDDGPEVAVWTIAPSSLPVSENWQSLTLLVDDPHQDCGHSPEGRIQEPTITYTDTEVIIEILLDGVPFGPATCEGWSPVELTVELPEDPGDRALVAPTGPVEVAPNDGVEEPTAIDPDQTLAEPDPAGGVDGPLVYGSQSDGGGEEALAEGVLAMVNGCLGVSGDGASTVFLWSFGYRWSPAGEVVSPDGSTFRLGDRIQAGGGFHSLDSVGRFANPLVVDQLAACTEGGGEVFIVQSPVELAQG